MRNPKLVRGCSHPYLFHLAFPMLCLVLGNSQSLPSENEDVLLGTVYDYVVEADSTLTPAQRKQILDNKLAQEITGWPAQHRLQNHRLVAYKRGMYAHAYTLVAVDSDLVVTPLSDKSHFNALLLDEGIVIRNEDDARDVAQLFMNCYYVTRVLELGWKLGVNAITSMDDITFRNEEERLELTRKVKIQPPSLIRERNVYQYMVYGWDRIGNGSLWKYQIVVEKHGILDNKRTKLQADVGVYENVM